VRDEVRLVDLMPTLLSAAGVTQQPSMQGRDVMALLRGERMPEAPALCELLVDKRNVRALRTNAFKVIEHPHATVGYDLVHDPGEERPIANMPQRVVDAQVALERSIAAGRELRKKIGASAEPAAAAGDLQRRMHDLGYVGREPTPK
jgi:arylsulfatase A-like enzyme